MSSTGTKFDDGYLKQGVILGTEHCYLKDGIWVRCDCGHEIMELIMCDFEDPSGYDYQIRCMGGHSMSKEESWNSCIQTKEISLHPMINVLESHSESCEIVDMFNLSYFLRLVKDNEDNSYTIGLWHKRKRRKDKCLWEIIIRQQDANALAKKLKNMVKRDNNDHGVH